MTIEQLGSIGEFVAAIAVVVSLVYLAIQIRQNTKQMKTQAWGDSFAAYSQFRKLVIANPELTRLRFLSIDKLSEEEQHSLEFLVEELCWCTNQLYLAVEAGMLGTHIWEGAMRRLLEYLESEHAKSCWDTWKKMYDEGFVHAVDDRMADRI